MIPSLDTYLKVKHDHEKRAAGYEKYAAVEIHHVHWSCRCKGMNPACRRTTKVEWRKKATTAQASKGADNA